MVVGRLLDEGGVRGQPVKRSAPGQLEVLLLGGFHVDGTHLASDTPLAPEARGSGSSVQGEPRLPQRQQEAQARQNPYDPHPSTQPPAAARLTA